MTDPKQMLKKALAALEKYQQPFEPPLSENVSVETIDSALLEPMTRVSFASLSWSWRGWW